VSIESPGQLASRHHRSIGALGFQQLAERHFSLIGELIDLRVCLGCHFRIELHVCARFCVRGFQRSGLTGFVACRLGKLFCSAMRAMVSSLDRLIGFVRSVS
jgi:hypothetical protein